MSFKNIIFLCIVLWALELNAQKDSKHPELPKSGKELQDIIPTGWEILSQTSGDLNGDGYEDLAFAIQSPVKETIEYNDGIESDSLQTNPRVLGIYFGKRNGKFKKTLQSNTFIINRNTPTMEEPFKGIQILPNGDLQIDFYIWPCRNCTSWSSHEYRFRYQNKAFELITYLESISQRVTGDEIYYNIDFPIKTLKITTETRNEDDEPEYDETLKKFELHHLKTIQSLGKPFEWEFLQLRI
ncbi:hypothetical protein ACOCEA_14875 [Maribacter sp. CXY002]|uniref:hypothetical protein n=1 Tax=Maribacter luteocoastalis TaxID=3407671 RepID=UPI003B675F03